MKKRIIINDLERIKLFLKILPENFMKHFLNSELFNGRYTEEDFTNFGKYTNYSEQILMQFKNKNIKKYYDLFSYDFDEILNFISENFFPSKTNTKNYLLYPELKYGNPDFYNRKLGEIRSLINKTEKSYINLIKSLKQYMEKLDFNKKQSTIFINNSQIHSGSGDNIYGDKKINKKDSLFKTLIISVIATVAAGAILFYLNLN